MSEAAPVFGKRVTRPGAAPAVPAAVDAKPDIDAPAPLSDQAPTPAVLPEIELPESWIKAKAAAAGGKTVRKTASPLSFAPVFDAVATERPSGPLEPLNQSYLKGCLTAFVIGMSIYALLLTTQAKGSNDMQLYAAFAMALMTLSSAPLLAYPIRGLAALAGHVGVQRGMADALIGGLVGASLGIPDIAFGRPPLLAASFLIGGVVGGFVFWRGRGAPRRPVTEAV